jgi:hypothetical protein
MTFPSPFVPRFSPRRRCSESNDGLVPERIVRFTEQFFNRLDSLLPDERATDGTPSVTDFIVHELPRVRDRLSEDFEGNTAAAEQPDVRVYVSSGILARAIAVFAALDDDDNVEAFWLSVEWHVIDTSTE